VLQSAWAPDAGTPPWVPMRSAPLRRTGPTGAASAAKAAASEPLDRAAFIALLDAFVATAHTHAAPRRADVGATWTLPSGASAATGPSGTIELIHDGGRTKLSPPLAGAYHVTIDGKDELRVAAPIARETDLRPRALKSQEASSHLGATQAQVDISPHIAIALLLLLTIEMVLRVRAQRDAQPA